MLKKLYICSINSTLYSHVKKMLDFMKSFIHSALQSTKTTQNPILLSQYIKFNNGKDNVGVPNSKHPRDFKNSERNEQFSLIQEIFKYFCEDTFNPRYEPAALIWKASAPLQKSKFWLELRLIQSSNLSFASEKKKTRCLHISKSVMCRKQEESTDHVVIPCEVAQKPWSRMVWDPPEGC